MDTYGFVSVIGLAGVGLLAYRAYMERAAHDRAKIRPPEPAPAEPATPQARRRRRRS
jgi:uncharacterized membrane protein YebE (DUF533 family)